MFESISIIWRLVRLHIAAQWGLLFSVVVLTIASTGSALYSPWLLKSVVDIDIPSGNLDSFTTSLIQAGAAYVAASCFWASQQVVAAMATERIFMDVKTMLLTQLVEQPRSFFDTRSDIEIVACFGSDLSEASSTFRDEIIAGLVEILLVFGLLAAALLIHWPIGLILVFGCIAYLLTMLLLHSTFVGSATRTKYAKTADIEYFTDAVEAARDIKFFNLAGLVRTKFRQSMTKSMGLQIKLSRFASMLRGGFSLGGALLSLAVILFSGLLIIQRDKTMTFGLMVQMLFITGLLGTTVNQLVRRFNRLVIALPTLKYLAKTMGLAPLASQKETLKNFNQHLSLAAQSPENLHKIPDIARIEFIDVGFTWPHGAAAFEHFNLRIEPAEKLALLGSSGGGKSLLLDLLMGMRQPTQGQLLYSGIEINQIERALYYSAFGFVGQNSHMMVGTLRQFLQQGWLGQTDEDLWRILQVVELHGMVNELPQKLDTPVGITGWQFSTGDHQRLMLARALLRDPQVLLLDDITQAMAPDASLELMQVVLRVSRNRTVICTTNNPAIAELFTRVVEL